MWGRGDSRGPEESQEAEEARYGRAVAPPSGGFSSQLTLATGKMISQLGRDTSRTAALGWGQRPSEETVVDLQGCSGACGSMAQG